MQPLLLGFLCETSRRKKTGHYLSSTQEAQQKSEQLPAEEAKSHRISDYFTSNKSFLFCLFLLGCCIFATFLRSLIWIQYTTNKWRKYDSLVVDDCMPYLNSSSARGISCYFSNLWYSLVDLRLLAARQKVGRRCCHLNWSEIPWT